MTLFTRILALWFLLFTLMSSTAWACAECSELAASTAGFAQASDPHPIHLWSGDRCQDHCGHAVAHLIGINVVGMALPFPPNGKEKGVFAQLAWYSVFQPPPYHPPIFRSPVPARVVQSL